jgi:hypothetical protein
MLTRRIQQAGPEVEGAITKLYDVQEFAIIENESLQ